MAAEDEIRRRSDEYLRRLVSELDSERDQAKKRATGTLRAWLEDHATSEDGTVTPVNVGDMGGTGYSTPIKTMSRQIAGMGRGPIVLTMGEDFKTGKFNPSGDKPLPVKYRDKSPSEWKQSGPADWISGKISSMVHSESRRGGTPEEVSERVMDRASEMMYNATLRTIRTKVNGAENASRLAAMPKDGLKVWNTVKDDRVRDSHAGMDGEAVPVDEPFSNGLMYPGDPSGPPSETYNCRCWITWSDGSGRHAAEGTDSEEAMTRNDLVEEAPDGFVDRLEDYLYGGEPLEYVLEDEDWDFMDDNNTRHDTPLMRMELADFTGESLRVGDRTDMGAYYRGFADTEESIEHVAREMGAYGEMQDYVVFETVGETYGFDVNRVMDDSYSFKDEGEVLVPGEFEVVGITRRKLLGESVKVIKVRQVGR